MKFIYKLLSLSLAIACLSGCSAANTEIASSSAATATVDPATDSTEVPASNNVFTSAGDGLYVTTDSGIYELQTVFPDSANIFYTDANTKERIFLCANPNCTHADESCPSYIATPSAMFPETDLSLSQIAAILGFSSSSYFSQTFRNAEGTSPTEYRKANQVKF